MYVVVALGVSDRWQVACGMWHVTFDTRIMTCDSGRMTHDILFLLHFVFFKSKKSSNKNQKVQKKSWEKSL